MSTQPTPPALPAPPLIGHALEFAQDRAGLFRRGYETLGPVFSIRLGPKPAAVLIGPEYHQVFFSETDNALRMDSAYTFLKAALGPVGFVGSPEIYNEQRPILHAPFKREKMVKYVEIMQEETQAWLDDLGDSGEIELVARLTQLVQNIAAHALMGREFREAVGEEFWALYGDLGKAMDPMLPPNLPLPKFIRRDRAKAEMRKIVAPILAERRANPDAYDDFLQDFVEARYKDGREVEDEVILGLVLALMFAGHETTVGQTGWTIIQLLQHPDYLAKVQVELAEHLPPGTAITGGVMRNLQHVAWAVEETGRMHPSADILMREAEQPLDVGEYHIPAGWMVFVTAGQAHYVEDVFPDADVYDPLRYAPGREEDKQHRHALITFGGGVHKCTGMNFATNEMMIITALLFQQFELALVTANPQASYGLGASRPAPTIIRYRRKPQRSLDQG